MRAVVVGGGIGGLATASLLSRNGFETTLLEKNASLGGRARVMELGRFKFDMGPSWYLMPEVFERFFKEAGVGEVPYGLRRVSPSFRIYYPDYGPVDYWGDLDQDSEWMEKIERGSSTNFSRYLEETKRMYAESMPFLYRPYIKGSDMARSGVLGKALSLHVFESMDTFNRRFFKSRKMNQLVGFTSVFLGGSPFNTPALYSLVNYPVLGQGVFYPEGGFGSLVSALASSIKGEVMVEEEVTQLGRERIKTSSGKEIPYDVAVLNLDYHYASEVLGLRAVDASYWERAVMSPSALLIYVGARNGVDIPHHSVFIGTDWEGHFNSIFKGDDLPQGVSYYVSVRSKSDSTVVKGYGDALFFLVPLPPGFAGDLKGLVRRVMEDFQRRTGEKLDVEEMRVYGPADFERDYHAYMGTAFGLAHTLSQTAVTRPPMVHPDRRNVLFVGQYTHPGIGVPMVTISAQLVAGIIGKQWKKM